MAKKKLKRKTEAKKKVSKKQSKKKQVRKKITKQAKVTKKASTKTTTQKKKSKKIVSKTSAAKYKTTKEKSKEKGKEEIKSTDKISTKEKGKVQSAALKKEEEKNLLRAEDQQLDFKDDGQGQKILDEIRDNITDEVLELAENFSLEDIFESISGLNLFETGADECLEKGCDNPVTTAGYCRLHYIKNWMDIKKKLNVLSEGKLQKFIEDLVVRYPVKYVESILEDLSDEKQFYNVLKELNIDSSEEIFDDETDNDDQDIVYETRASIKSNISDD